ncbi:magnesium transporter [Ferruginibacter albus]|uniref:magnesium transporter n=1 Tax=Ferruginibacter albus TaxID=2875540 RepID=UPI001CC701FE|nr:magnesium transporter [Ferruginibacter albus]UAY51368.1 magnesium transporter [Ferruginibacter albus]
MSLELEDISIQQQFEKVIATGDKLQLQEFLDEQNITDVVELVYENEDHEGNIMNCLSTHRAASVFKILELTYQKRIIKELSPHKTAELLNELPPDDRTAFLSELPSNVVRELVKTLDPEERKVTLSLLGYPENSVGRLMTPDYVYVYENDSVNDVLDTIRRFAKNSETIDVIYVINEKGELLDDIRIRDFILASPDKKVSELMDERYISLYAEDDQEVANEAFKMNNRVALPVVSQSNKLLGIVTIDDVLWVTNEEFSEDIQKIGGTEVLDQPYLEMPIFKLVKKRASWLIILFLSEMLTATAMQYFSKEIEAAAVLALFIPLIMSSGGNSGSQASTLIIQAMALGELTITDWWRVMRREIISGLLLGLTLGSIGFLRIFLWQHMHIYDYGIYWKSVATVIFFSLTGIVLWGSLMGSMLPIILKKLKLDPATSSAPFVATLVDVTGIIIYFSVAYIFLKGYLL